MTRMGSGEKALMLEGSWVKLRSAREWLKRERERGGEERI